MFSWLFHSRYSKNLWKAMKTFLAIKSVNKNVIQHKTETLHKTTLQTLNDCK